MYLSLYRKYRPDTFDLMVGQEHITTILKNQVKSGKIGHAYLFAGTRGTGKTTAAKVLARAVNCLAPKNGNPCNECESCKMLLNPANVDVLEIDAASNNRVDEIREIREKVQFTPVSAKYKVYIIDEVHMLTDSAFNALLKTLEEPPRHAIFILATTEAHKLPATILSRCMRFDFKLISTDELEKLLKKIFDEQKKKYEPEALAMIAAAGEGSARDALSIADMCLSYSEGALRYADVLNILGATDFDTLSDLAARLLDSDIGGLFSTIDKLLKAGKSVGVLARDLLKYFRDLLILKSCKDASKLLNLPKDIFEKLKAQAEHADIDTVFSVIEIFSGIEQELRYSTQPRIVLETAALRIANRNNRAQSEVPKSAAAPEKTTSAPQETKKETGAKMSPSAIWGNTVKALRESGQPILYAVCGNITEVAAEENNFVIYANTAADESLLKKPDNMAELKRLISTAGIEYNIVVKDAASKRGSDKGDDIKKLTALVGKNKLKIE